MRRCRVSPTTAIALAALFFSLGGIGLAASRYVITSTSQIAPNVLRYLHGERGPRGAQGPAGAPGVAGTPGTFTAANVTFVGGPTVAVCAVGGGSCGIATSTATCPAGTTIISGGWQGSVVLGMTSLNEAIGTTQWTVTIDNEGLIDGQFQAIAECAS